MILTRLRIKNYRALRDIDIPLSRFVCLTGENNAGKSSILLGLSLFRSGKSLDLKDFYDPTQQIDIEVSLAEVTPAYLALLGIEAGERISKLVVDKKLTLVRRYDVKEKSELGYFTKIPKDVRFAPEAIKQMIKGKLGKAIGETVAAGFPEIAAARIAEIKKQGDVGPVIDELAATIADDQKVEVFATLPSGADFSITPMLPEIIYIPAVKDLADDIKTTETSSFGKILGIVLEDILPLLKEQEDLFTKLSQQLSRTRTHSPEGTVVVADQRLEKIQLIESTIESYVRESFSNIKLELDIPPPKLDAILSTTRILADDGTLSGLETKGDGLRRTVVFAILRTYVKLVELRASEAKAKQAEAKAKEAATQPDEPNPEEVEVAKRSYLLLFEEPELFLHPDAQGILFEALGKFAVDHHVVVTTHSPLFLGPEATATFVRVAKHTDAAFPKPYSIARPVDLSVLGQKDAFQIICFENNNAAFFAKKIVLVEGDSDQIIFPHIAQLLEPSWTCARHSVAFVQIGGKGSIRRYREFFELFNVAVYVIADLDLLLKGFRILNADAALQNMQTDLVALLDREITVVAGKNTQELKEANKSGEIKALWARAKLAKAAYDKDRTPENLTSMTEAVDAFFAWETNDERLRLLGESTTPEIVATKLAFLEALRKQKVFVLSRGAIEEYYPTTIAAGEKPARAQQFRKAITTREGILACCDKLPDQQNLTPEFELIFRPIFT